MGIEEQVSSVLAGAIGALVEAGKLPAEALTVEPSVARPRRAEHGDLATNAALTLRKLSGQAPRELAAVLAAELTKASIVRSAEVAGPGFINLRLDQSAFAQVLRQVLHAGPGFARAPAATGERVLVEFVSANPTGPLLISHGRGAIYGDGVARLLEATGHRVSREYYVNDFGNQVRLFARSVRAAAAGEPPPEGGYGGGYVSELGRHLAMQEPALLATDDDAALGRVAVARMLDGVPGSGQLGGIRRTLGALGIHFDNWFSEEGLHRWGRVGAALASLGDRDELVERQGALFFLSEQQGDDKDRVVRKSDGLYTYFASDIAYHDDKYRRGYDRMIDVLGADHHGYEARVRGAMRALGHDDSRFEVLFFQLVNLLRDGKPYKMGKRLGNLITIDEVLEEIDEAAQRAGAGADALRYFYLSRRSDHAIDIDIELAKRASVDNPVFYLQMGYARLCSIARRAHEVFGLALPAYSEALAARVEHPDELAIVAVLGRFPALVREAAAAREPHRVVFYLTELSQQFQSYFTRLKKEGDAILPLESETERPGWRQRWDRDKSLARLLWVEAIRTVYGAGLRLLGITALSHMEPLAERQGESEEAK